jgi:cysteinyl-tRNA synthetase
MSAALLGETFDIHAGGIDLVFPHHENEIAQSRCAFHQPVMANFWLHNGFLQVEGEKMSKSLGNFVTINELLKDWHGFGWPGEALRFNMLHTHYRQPIDWTLHGLDESHKILWQWYGDLHMLSAEESLSTSVLEPILDDLNTPGVIASLHELHRNRNYGGLRTALNFLGFSCDRKNLARIASTTGTSAGTSTASGVGSTKAINKLIFERAAARKAKDFKESDRIRVELAKMGVVLKDSKDPKTGEPVTTWERAR